MAMAIETSHQPRFLDSMSSYGNHNNTPQFTNPWQNNAASQSHQTQQQSHQPHHQQNYISDGPLEFRHQHQSQHQNQRLQQQQHQQQHQSTQHHQTGFQLPQPSPSGPHHYGHAAHQQTSPGSQHIPSPLQQQPASQIQRYSSAGGQKMPLGQQPLPPPPGITASAPVPAFNTTSSSMTVGGAPPGAGPHQHQRQGSFVQAPLSVATTSAAYSDATAAYSSPSPINPNGPNSYVTAGVNGVVTTATPYDQMHYAPINQMRGGPPVAASAVAPYGLESVADVARRFSQADASQQNAHAQTQLDNRRGFQDAIEASHGIMSLSQDTPRPINYRNPDSSRSSRGSGESYGFPTPQSNGTSVSGSLYNGGSVDSNITDYSSNGGSDMECGPRMHSHPAMPQLSHSVPPGRPMMSTRQPLHMGQGIHGINGYQPSGPQSMMSQFNTKQQSSAQKKHKCRICEKRFTRPSSLQTHMYSHTGEKPFICDFPNCGRPFSVVSNLRRHSKVHQRDGAIADDLTHDE